MTTIRVDIPAVPHATYEVRIGSGLLKELGPIARSVAPAPSAAIISDSNVAPRYLAAAKASLEGAGYRVIPHVFPAGEEHKNVVSALGAIDTLLNSKVERATPVIALGGGVVGDLGGFVAATTLRGLPFIQAPTTLLAAVDASVGGKVGVDHKAGKNLIGAFHQPRIVLTDIDTFASLPLRELRGGLAECVKHAVIRDASLFSFISDNVVRLIAFEPAVLAELVAKNVAIKAAVVHEDPFENGVRALLNFGHTFGHAIENVLNYSGIIHGEAVALGMVAASHLAHARGEFSAEDMQKIRALLERIGLPTSVSRLDVDQTFGAMATDKKVRSGKLRFVLPTKIGEAHVVSDVAEAQVRNALLALHQRREI